MAYVGRTPSLSDIPDEPLANTTSHMARLRVIDVASLGRVSRAFRRHWNTEGVRREHNLGTLQFKPTIGNSEKIRSLAVAMTRFCVKGNPEALYWEGITSYFDNRRRERADEGLAQLEDVAERGYIKARYLYDLILVCWFGERRDEGFDMLAMLIKPLLLESVVENLEMRNVRKRLEMRNVINNIIFYLDLLQGGHDKHDDVVLDYVSYWSCDQRLFE